MVCENEQSYKCKTVNFFGWHKHICQSPGCLEHRISPVTIHAFVRVPFLITCLAHAGSVFNINIMIVLHFLAEHGQKNMQKRGEVTAASKTNSLPFLLKQQFCPSMPATAQLHSTEILSALRFTGPVTQIVLLTSIK